MSKWSIITSCIPTGRTSLIRIETISPFSLWNIDSEKHKEYTTQPNELILENARKIAKSGVKLVIRVPVIPGFNCSENEIKAIARFASTLDNVKELHLLPYHRLGEPKYEGLGREYLMGDKGTIPKEHMEKLKQVVEAEGLMCHIGG